MLLRFRFCPAMLLICAFIVTPMRADPVPGLKRDLDFDALMKAVDLNDPALRLEYKRASTAGSSIGLHIGIGDKPTYASFVPTNTSSVPEAEVVAYRLARFLGVSRNYYPVDYYNLTGGALEKFADLVRSTPEWESDRVANRRMVREELAANPATLLGIYRLKPSTRMYPASSLGTEGQFWRKTALGETLQAYGPMPSTELMTLDGVKSGRANFPSPPKEQQVELARQLSTIFVIDQLTGQWDRFWGNLEASGDRNGRLKLVARDNGGATFDDWDDYETYNKWVSRYDRDLIKRLTALNSFLKGASPTFLGLTSPGEWREAAGFLSQKSFTAFRKKLALLIEKRVPALSRDYGDHVFFPAKSAEIAAFDLADTCEED